MAAFPRIRITRALTLIELVVALTMFALLGTALVVTLHNGLRTWDRVQHVSEQESQLRWLWRMLGGDLEQAVLLTDAKDILPQFTGQSLSVVTVTYDDADSLPHVLRVQVTAEEQADGSTALKRYVAPFPADPRGPFGRAQVLFEHLTACTFEYLYQDRRTNELIWQPVWSVDAEKPALPRALRLTLRAAPSRSMPASLDERTHVFSLPLGVVGTTEPTP